MSELRQDPTTGRTVIIAPQRQLRPGAQRLVRRAERVAATGIRSTLSLLRRQRSFPARDRRRDQDDAPPHWAVRHTQQISELVLSHDHDQIDLSQLL